MSFAPISRRSVHSPAVDPPPAPADHWCVAEYALVTAVMASLAVSLAAIPQSQLSKQLPVTAQRAQALVTKSARTSSVPVAGARAALARAPFSRPALRYLYAAGWIGGRLRPTECAFAKVSTDAIERDTLATIKKDSRLVTRLRRMRVTLAQAADALTQGTASAC
jgi:hypothetical protein